MQEQLNGLGPPDESRTVYFESEVERRGFVQLPNVVLLDERLSAAELRLYALLRYYAREDESCFPGQERLASSMGVNERQLRRYVRGLEDAGLVRTQRRGLGKTNVYALLDLSMSGRYGRVSPVRPDTEDRSDRSGMSGEVEAVEVDTEEEDRARDVADFWAYWCERRRPRSTNLTSGQERLIERGLKVATLEELKVCVDSLLASAWHNANGKLSLSSILSTGPGTPALRDKIDGFLDSAPSSSPAPTASGLTPAEITLRKLRAELTHINDQPPESLRFGDKLRRDELIAELAELEKVAT